MRTLSYRRNQEAKSKAKARKKLLQDPFLIGRGENSINKYVTQKRVGRMASIHSCPCSCEVCGNPRKHFKAQKLSELKSKESFEQSFSDI